MQRDHPPLEVRVWGDMACFTRPEMKVERVSYPVMTPSAARGLLESIFWKPQVAWRVEEVWVLNPVPYFPRLAAVADDVRRNPIRYVSLMRNEVNHRASERAARNWARDGTGGYIASDDRAQRHTLALREVAYLIRAHITLRPGVADDIAKFRDQFRRRVRDGRCFTPPYLGCREFVAAFAEPDGSEQAIDLTDDLGPMLLDMAYATDGSGRGTPRFFHARLERGVLRVPPLEHIEEEV